MSGKQAIKTWNSRRIRLLFNHDNWEHDPKSELKKLSMSNVSQSVTDDDLKAVATAILSLVTNAEDDSYLEGVEDIQSFLIL